MEPKTLKALQESIDHWRRFETGTEAKNVDPSSDHCALCQLFLALRSGKTCQGCPVSERTNRTLCRRSPWVEAQSAFHCYGPESKLFKERAKAEREFLESLLPVRPPVMEDVKEPTPWGGALKDKACEMDLNLKLL